MAYRSGPDAGPPTRIVLCVECAKPTEVRERDESFRCVGCKRTQPTRRTDADAPRVHTATFFRAHRYTQLVPFAQSMGVAEPCGQVTVRCDGLECEVTLYINSGRVGGLELNALTSGFPTITFTRETAEERKAKAAGVTREVQSGDAALDDAVYIESDATDADILAVLDSPAVRAALLRLSRDFTSIKMTPTGIELTGNHEEPACYEPSRISEELTALRIVAGAARSLAPAVKPRSRIALVAKAITLPLVPVGFSALIFTIQQVCPVFAWIGFAGAAAGLVVGLAVQPLLRRAFSGHSTSHRELSLTRGGSLLGIPLLGAALTIASNAVFDGAPPHQETLPIVASEWDSEDQQTMTTVRSPTLGEAKFHFDDNRQLSVGDTVTVWTRPGAFGVPWYSQPAVAHTRAGNREFIE